MEIHITHENKPELIDLPFSKKDYIEAQNIRGK
jgi:hypothetical protein